jgi:outer membrane protein, heavy metal efflux system
LKAKLGGLISQCVWSGLAAGCAAFGLALLAAGAVFAQGQGPVRITLDEAIQKALQHNHSLLAQRTTIQQSQAEEVTANLRPNPVITADTNYLPIFQPSQFSTDYLNNNAEFDVDFSYLIERGKKRQHRLQAARDQTAVTQSQVADDERTLTFQVAQQFVNAQLAESTLDLAQQDLKSFQDTVNISQDRFRAGDISEGDFLKIKLQLLQFQTDVSQAQLARTQSLSDLRHSLGFESVPPDYDVAGAFEYQPLKVNLEDLQLKALSNRPDLRAAQQGITAANSQLEEQRSIGKRDVTAEVGYSHTNATSSALILGSIEIPIFTRNQGEIARAQYGVTQAQEQQTYANEQVLTDVKDAYEGLEENDQVTQLYQSGYLDAAQQGRDISDYAYQRGALSLLDFLDAERSYRATELAYRQAIASYLLAIEQLREAVGSRTLP